MNSIGCPVVKSFEFYWVSVQDSHNPKPIKVIYKRIRPTKAAIRFFAEQARARKAFDKAEKINQDFQKAVRELWSYPGWYTLPAYNQDCLFLLWQERCRENPLLDKINYHDGEYCRRYGCKFCTPKQEIDKHEKKREQWFKDKHKGRNEQARQRRAVKIERLQQADLLPLPQQDEPNLMEDFEPL